MWWSIAYKLNKSILYCVKVLMRPWVCGCPLPPWVAVSGGGVPVSRHSPHTAHAQPTRKRTQARRAILPAMPCLPCLRWIFRRNGEKSGKRQNRGFACGVCQAHGAPRAHSIHSTPKQPRHSLPPPLLTHETRRARFIGRNAPRRLFVPCECLVNRAILTCENANLTGVQIAKRVLCS